MIDHESVADNQTQPPPASASQGAAVHGEVASDEDWKNRVKAEDAALDQQFRSQPAGSESQPSSSTTAAAPATSPASAESAGGDRPAQQQAARNMPDPTFGDLVGLLSTQAMMFLGLIPNPATQKPETQLPTARYFIDIISILEEKTAGQLTKQESNILDETLHELRMIYMQRSKQTT
jgi:Domain of unknown function (DUF1844)